jgi:hypothetical protein
LVALESLRSDVQTYSAIISKSFKKSTRSFQSYPLTFGPDSNAAQMTSQSQENENSTSIIAIREALTEIIKSVGTATKTIQSAPANKRDQPTDLSGTVPEIEDVARDIATELVSVFTGPLDNIADCE